MANNELKWSADEIADACVKAGLGILECHSLMVTLKATPPVATPAQGGLSDALPNSPTNEEIVEITRHFWNAKIRWFDVVGLYRFMEKRIRGQQGGLSDELSRDVGYESGTLISDPTGLGAEIHLHFVSPAHGEIAFEWITEAIEVRILGQQGSDGHLRTAIEQVCEGWTLPHDARKVLETALWANGAVIQAQAGDAPTGGAL